MRITSDPHPTLFIVATLSLSLLTAGVCAAVYVIVLHWSLPPTDEAYGQTIGQLFSDPFVRLIAAEGATVVGFLFFPLALVFLWRKELLRCGFFVLVVTLLGIVLITPISICAGLIASILAALGALVFCRFTNSAVFSGRRA